MRLYSVCVKCNNVRARVVGLPHAKFLLFYVRLFDRYLVMISVGTLFEPEWPYSTDNKGGSRRSTHAMAL